MQHRSVPAAAWWGSLAVGLPACAVLMVNNIRDRIGDERRGQAHAWPSVSVIDAARRLFVGVLGLSLAAVIPIGIDTPPALLGLLAVIFAIGPMRIVSQATAPPRLVAALVMTVRYTVALAALLTVGLVLA